MMTKNYFRYLFVLLFFVAAHALSAQQRRPIDNQHPLWLVHVDVWNSADPQKIIDLIPAEIKPYVCMNLSLSCGYDKETNMYRMPRCAVRTYKSWASVCQANNMWFTCQPASGGHTHIQDDDLETFEYFFKTYPNFLGWNYAEQFWGFNEENDESSSQLPSRLALFAKLVPMHHQYGGVLTISFCGNVWSHPLNPMGMMRTNTDLLRACRDYPEAILWLYKYTTSSCWYNNESVTFGPFISGLAKNYGVRYDNCGWNGATDDIVGKNKCTYPGAAGIAPVMEQTCVNGGAVWDGPELIWTEDFKNLSNSTVDGYTRRNWGYYPNFQGVWMDMFKKIIDGTLYIPSRAEVVGKTKLVIQNDMPKTSGSDEDRYAAWGDLYDGLYKQDDPFNTGNGQWMSNYCYYKKTGRYGAIPLVIALYDDVAKSIPTVVKKSVKWSSTDAKVNQFNSLYPEVSTGDLYVNRYRNHLVTYTPYSYLNKKKSATGIIPLQYNTCETLKLYYGKLSSGFVREYADHIDFYLNNYRSDSTAVQTDSIVVTGVTSQPSFVKTLHETGATGYSVEVTDNYNATAQTYKVVVKHMGPLDLTINCSGAATGRQTDVLPAERLSIPQQPNDYVGPIVIEAENMDYKDVKNVALTHSGWWATSMNEFAGMGYVEMGTKKTGALRHELTLKNAGTYDIYVRYCGASAAGKLALIVNTSAFRPEVEKTALNDWRKFKVTADLKAGTNTLRIVNSQNGDNGIDMVIDQIVYVPAGTPAEKFCVAIRDAEHGQVVADVDSAAEGQTVKLTILPEQGYGIQELRVINSVYYTMGKTIPVEDGATEVTFVMNDDNCTIQPVFYEKSAVYAIDLKNTLAGTMPKGWRVVAGDDVHEYPNNYSQGSRTMSGFTGYQGNALYWRDGYASYGEQTSFPLNLQPGHYKLTFAMAAWKGTPQYTVQLLKANTTTNLLNAATYTATPNASGNGAANLSSAAANTLTFDVTEAGNYVVKFVDKSTYGSMHEFLLLECRINEVTATGISTVMRQAQLPQGIYSASGVRRQSLRQGLNIVVGANGQMRKVMVK